MNTSLSKRTMNLVLAGILIALGTVLSFIKITDMPYGGSITICSMLPVMFFAYRTDVKWGLGAGLVFSVLQLLFGLNGLKGISGVMVIGSILLDYILAFTVLGLAGIFRGKLKNDAIAFTLGTLMAGLLRYFCSFLSGWLLWSQFMEVTDMQGLIANFFPGLSALTGNALAIIYSLCYNGIYMIPEIVVTSVVGAILMQVAGKYLLEKKTAAEA